MNPNEINRVEVERLGRGKYLSLTTFKRDGTAVATPVWVARDGDNLVVITDASSGKAKRIRNNGQVELAPCDVRGRVKGRSIAGRAALVDSSETTTITNQIERKYGLAYAAMGWLEKLRRRRPSDSVGIRIHVNQTLAS